MFYVLLLRIILYEVDKRKKIPKQQQSYSSTELGAVSHDFCLIEYNGKT